jgi:hypothetical protein
VTNVPHAKVVVVVELVDDDVVVVGSVSVVDDVVSVVEVEDEVLVEAGPALGDVLLVVELDVVAVDEVVDDVVDEDVVAVLEVVVRVVAVVVDGTLRGGLVEVVTVVVVVVVTQPPAVHASKQLDAGDTQALPPFGLVQRAGVDLIEHVV